MPLKIVQYFSFIFQHIIWRKLILPIYMSTISTFLSNIPCSSAPVPYGNLSRNNRLAYTWQAPCHKSSDAPCLPDSSCHPFFCDCPGWRMEQKQDLEPWTILALSVPQIPTLSFFEYEACFCWRHFKIMQNKIWRIYTFFSQAPFSAFCKLYKRKNTQIMPGAL